MLHFLLSVNVVAACWVAVGSTEYTNIVQTSYGPVKGEELTYEGTEFKAFKGIPYAASPIGDLRFKAPQPPEKWTEVLDTTGNVTLCMQPYKQQRTSEDCLTLNVYTKSIGDNSSRPVLVCILGYGFRLGGSLDDFGPEYLIREDIVIVTMNYRLGIYGLYDLQVIHEPFGVITRDLHFDLGTLDTRQYENFMQKTPTATSLGVPPKGFLSTNTSEASGNWGLKDQVAALKWVQENIEQFGGDPKQVTLYGHSSGAACAHLHMFSPLSEGLFHKVILSSGSVTNDWTMALPGEPEKVSQMSAKIGGAPEIEVENPAKRLDILAALVTNTNNTFFRLQGWQLARMFNDVAFKPVVENPGTEGAFLTEYPSTLLAEGRFAKVPMMIGVTNLEAIPYLVNRGGNVPTKIMNKCERNICALLPVHLAAPVHQRGECAKVAEVIKAVYFDGKPFNSSELNYLNFRADILVVLGVYVAERLHIGAGNSDSPVYKYQFTFDGEITMKKSLPNCTLSGAAHPDVTTYIFQKGNHNVSQLAPDSPDVVTMNRMVRFIANFVQFGDPTPSVTDLIPVKWEPATKEESKTMVIDNELKMENEFLKNRMDMWNQLYTEYTGSPLFN